MISLIISFAVLIIRIFFIWEDNGKGFLSG